MLLLLAGILIFTIIVSTVCYYKCRNNEPFAIINVLCCIMLGVVVVTTVVGTVQVVKLPALEQQMVLCRARCDEVTATITELTKNYAAYETAVYQAAADGGLKLTYPDANGATLAQQQINLYDSWQTALYNLEQEIPVCNAWKWWLYFGDATPRPIDS